MNSFKIAIRNIKKSWGDYTVYFITLIIGVSIFYMFNAVGTQGIMQDVAASGSETVQTLISAVNMVSVLVAIVLGLLIIYANNFLIKRRKKEFGIYMLLGMGKKKVSRILLCETGMVGLISLAAGLVVGVFGSQLLSILVAKMFAVDVTAYRFAISEKALVLTVFSFAVIFFVVLLFNTVTVSKYKLIDLINASKVRERQLIRNTKVSVVIFAVSLILLLLGYIRIGFSGEQITKEQFVIHVLLIIAGTVSLYWSLAGFFQKVLSGNEKLYKKDLNAFVIRQFSGNVNTAAFSMAVISLLLMAAIVAFSSGFSFRTYLNRRLGNATPVDMSMRIWNGKALDYLAENGIPAEDWAEEYFELPVYECETITTGASLGVMIEEAKKTFLRADWDSRDNIMRLSDYNKLERAYGRNELVLAEDQYLIVSDFDLLNKFQDPALEKGTTLTIAGKEYRPAQDHVVYEYVLMSGMSADMGVTVFPDAAIDDAAELCSVTSRLLIADYRVSTKEEREAVDAKLFAVAEQAVDASRESVPEDGRVAIMLSTRNRVEENSIGISVIAVFLVLYIGIVFVVACVAILSLRVMSDCIDSEEQYRILKRIGAGEGLRKKAVFQQVLMNFLLPLITAVFGAIFALHYVQGLLSVLGMVSLGPGILVTFLIMIVLYGGYFFTTYESCKKMI